MSTQQRYVAYLRVSTQAQGRSGLGLEAQRETVRRHIASVGGTLLSEHVEVESGRKVQRVKLDAALAECRALRAQLVIAKLDRLARNVAFVSNLLEAGVEFIVADMPVVNRLTIHILAAVAEEEARVTSARTKSALAAAKARGVRLGNPNLQPGNAEQARDAATKRSANSKLKADRVRPYITAAQAAGAVTLRELANALTARGVPIPSGRVAPWHAETVRRVLARIPE